MTVSVGSYWHSFPFPSPVLILNLPFGDSNDITLSRYKALRSVSPRTNQNKPTYPLISSMQCFFFLWYFGCFGLRQHLTLAQAILKLTVAQTSLRLMGHLHAIASRVLGFQEHATMLCFLCCFKRENSLPSDTDMPHRRHH